MKEDHVLGCQRDWLSSWESQSLGKFFGDIAAEEWGFQRGCSK